MTFKRKPRQTKTILVLVADRAEARFFRSVNDQLDDFEEFNKRENPEGAARPQEIDTDGQGVFRTTASAPHQGEPETDFKHRTAMRFAQQLVDDLEQMRTRNEIGQVVLIASPLMLGVLREEIPGPLKKLVLAEVDSDLTHADVAIIRETAVEAISRNSPGALPPSDVRGGERPARAGRTK